MNQVCLLENMVHVSKYGIEVHSMRNCVINYNFNRRDHDYPNYN